MVDEGAYSSTYDPKETSKPISCNRETIRKQPVTWGLVPEPFLILENGNYGTKAKTERVSVRLSLHGTYSTWIKASTKESLKASISYMHLIIYGKHSSIKNK